MFCYNKIKYEEYVEKLFNMAITKVEIPSKHSRTTPEKALKAYFSFIKSNYWESCYAYLSWVAKRDDIILPEIKEIYLSQGKYSFSSPKCLSTYWREFNTGNPFRNNRITRFKVNSARYLSTNLALVSTTFYIKINLASVDISKIEDKNLFTKILGEDTDNVIGTMKRIIGFSFVDILNDFRDFNFHFEWPVYKYNNSWYLLSGGIPEDMDFCYDDDYALLTDILEKS